jgi:hypothetical protein
MVTALLIIHGLIAVLLLGAITHQVLATLTLAPARSRGSFFSRFRAVRSASFVDAVIVLYAVSAILGAIVYFYFGIGIRPALENSRQWHILGLFDIKEHFAAIGAALLPAYWFCWRGPDADQLPRTRTALTLILAFIVWWSFLVGHVMNNVMGFGS